MADSESVESRVIHRLVDFCNKDVLEIGCGDGRMTWFYAHEASSVLGIDPSEKSITQAQKDTPTKLQDRVTFQIGDITSLQPPLQSFDIALLSWSI